MSRLFGLVLSRPTDADAVTRALGGLLPGTLIPVANSLDELPGDPEVWAQLNPTSDPAWPVAVDLYGFPDVSPLDPYPDLRIAEHLSRELGLDVLADPADVVPGLDPHNPYWFLAYVGSDWFLVDMSETPLMGPYTDGDREFPGDGELKLVRPVHPWGRPSPGG